MGAVRPVLGAIQGGFCGGPDSRWAVKESQSLGPLLSPWGSCQHQLSFLGHVPWCLQHQEVSGNSDSGLGLDCLACQGWELLLTLFQVGLGQVILEVSGGETSSGKRPSSVCCLLILRYRVKDLDYQPVGVAESLQAIRSKPLNVQKGKLRPRANTANTANSCWVPSLLPHLCRQWQPE